MSYISARENRKTDAIDVVERVKGRRIFTSYPADHSFYIESPTGKYQSIYRTPLDKITPLNRTEFQKELAIRKGGARIFESDLHSVFKILSQNYKNQPAPEIQIGFLDIEVAFCPERGHAPIEDPFNEITSITILHYWTKQLITLALPPKTIPFEKAQEIAARFDNTFVFESEIELLNTFLDLIEDCDVLSGWNSKFFDLPYLINRISRIMSADDTRRFNFWNEKPKPKVVTKYGNDVNTYDLVGRIHLDLMDVYRKFTYEERHSYSLNAIAEHELQKSKTPYAFSLDRLYKEDFEKFIEYNRQDVILLGELEDKLKFLALLNDLAHDTTTLMDTCMGTVMMVDQAIINRAHDLGFIVPNKRRNFREEVEEEEHAVGAYVAHPKTGLQEWVGVIDVNSLYPSVIRALNMGLETIVGQLRPVLSDQMVQEKMKIKNMTFAHAWENQFGSFEYQAVMAQKPGVDITIDWEESGENDTLSAKQCYDLIFNGEQPWMLSGNGTIFQTDIPAIIPGLLSQWYSDRKDLQKKKKEATTPSEVSYYDRRQLIRKINLNSLYGALLNNSSRFNDQRIGQSVTLTGRGVCHHMNSFVNECVTGKYDVSGDAVLAADTDSSNFSAWTTIKPLVDSGELVWDKEKAVELYMAIGDKVNESFQGFMKRAYNCPDEFGKLIKASCESVGYRGLYITKKRYAILNYYVDGKYLAEPKLKAMGLDLRRSDTPEVCQEFLKKILLTLLEGGSEKTIIDEINAFKLEFKNLPLHEQGTPKRVNKITHYTSLIKNGKGNRVPGHVRAAINWNTLRSINNDHVHTRILDGMKCVCVPLKNNALKMTSVAYPIDEVHLPDWFLQLPMDHNSMIQSVVYKKLENLLGILQNWNNIEAATIKGTSFNDFFS